MYTKEDISAITQKFWTKFGLYMAPVPSVSSDKVNWINYKTGIKGISFKMNVYKESATVAIEISLQNIMLQHQYFQIFTNFAKRFKELAGNGWVMKKDYLNEDQRCISKLFIELKAVNIFKEEDWPSIISFLKKNIIALDAFGRNINLLLKPYKSFKTIFKLLKILLYA